MAKFLCAVVTRTSSTELYIEVPDEFKEADLMRVEYRKRIGKLAKETTGDYDWDGSEWEDTVEVQSVGAVTEEEAKKYTVGKLKGGESC